MIKLLCKSRITLPFLCTFQASLYWSKAVHSSTPILCQLAELWEWPNTSTAWCLRADGLGKWIKRRDC